MGRFRELGHWASDGVHFYYKAAIVSILAMAALTLFASCSTSYTRTDQARPNHHTDEGFRNLFIEKKSTTFFSYQKMRHFGEDAWAEYEGNGHQVAQTQPDLTLLKQTTPLPRFTWIGHATVLIQYQGINILTDPIFSERASPIPFTGPKRVTQPALTVEQLPKIDIVLISHNHYDHLDQSTVEKIGNSAIWIVPLGYKKWFKDLGISNVKEFDWWDVKQIKNIEITATPSQHWTARGLFDRYQQLWAAWSIKINDFNFWFAGDTGYNTKQFKEIGDRLGPFDFAIIPIGGYAPRWFMKDMHVNPAEAVEIHRDIKSKYSLGVHWGAFPLTAESIDEPPIKLEQTIKSLTETKFVTAPLGKTLLIE